MLHPIMQLCRFFWCFYDSDNEFHCVFNSMFALFCRAVLQSVNTLGLGIRCRLNGFCLTEDIGGIMRTSSMRSTYWTVPRSLVAFFFGPAFFNTTLLA